MTPSRREFLGALAASAVAIRASAESPQTRPAERTRHPDAFQHDGALVILPSRGRLYIASDFHTRFTDFQRWLVRTDIERRLTSGEDAYGLILGDVIDVKPLDTQAEKDGDLRILDKLRQIQTGKNGDRLILLMGNHEFAAATIYGALKKHFNLNPTNQHRLVQALYRSENGSFYQQFNFLERMNDDHFAYIRDLPVAALCKNGVLATHAGASKSARSPRELAQREAKIVDELVWSRPAELNPDIPYTEDELVGFLSVMEDSQVLISGHTPLSSLPPEWLHNGVGVYGDRQMILATSYGSSPGEKSYLVLDQRRRYKQVRDLLGELHRLVDAPMPATAPSQSMSFWKPNTAASPLLLPRLQLAAGN